MEFSEKEKGGQEMSGEVHRGQIFQGIVDPGEEFRFI